MDPSQLEWFPACIQLKKDGWPIYGAVVVNPFVVPGYYLARIKNYSGPRKVYVHSHDITNPVWLTHSLNLELAHIEDRVSCYTLLTGVVKSTGLPFSINLKEGEVTIDQPIPKA